MEDAGARQVRECRPDDVDRRYAASRARQAGSGETFGTALVLPAPTGNAVSDRPPSCPSMAQSLRVRRLSTARTPSSSWFVGTPRWERAAPGGGRHTVTGVATYCVSACLRGRVSSGALECPIRGAPPQVASGLYGVPSIRICGQEGPHSTCGRPHLPADGATISSKRWWARLDSNQRPEDMNASRTDSRCARALSKFNRPLAVPAAPKLAAVPVAALAHGGCPISLART